MQSIGNRVSVFFSIQRYSESSSLTGRTIRKLQGRISTVSNQVLCPPPSRLVFGFGEGSELSAHKLYFVGKH